jgi:hypothetical protein
MEGDTLSRPISREWAAVPEMEARHSVRTFVEKRTAEHFYVGFKRLA